VSSAEGSSANSNIPNGSVGTSCLLDAAAAVESCSALTLARNIDSLETSKHRIGQQVVAFSTEMQMMVATACAHYSAVTADGSKTSGSRNAFLYLTIVG